MASASLHQVGTSSAGSSSLRRLGTILRERAWLLTLCTLLGGGLAVAYIFYAPKNYAATATVECNSTFAKLLDLMGGNSIEPAQQIREAQRSLRNPEILRQLVLTQRLQEDPRFNGNLTGDEAVSRAAEFLKTRLSSDAPDNDIILSVTFTGPAPDLAARVANGAVDALLAANARERAALIDQVKKVLRDQLSDLQKELQPAPPTSPTSPPGSPSLGSIVEQFRQLTEALVTAELQRSQLEADLRQANSQSANLQGTLQIPYISEQTNVLAARAVLLQKQLELENLAQRYKEKHPDYQQAKAAVDAARAALEKETAAALTQLQAAAAAAQAHLDELKARQQVLLTQITPPTSATPTTPVAQTSSSEYEVLRRFAERVMEKRKLFELGPEAILPPLRQLQLAYPPSDSLGPSQAVILALGLLGGLVVGLLLSLVFGYGDTSLKTVDEVEDTLGLPVLGVVPRLKGGDSELAAAEGFRSLRTSIAVSSRDHEPRLLQFTSTSPDEGKTFCALNFAVGLAQQSHKTVLIECDLRRPMAAPSLTLVKVDAPGVSDFLKSDAAKPGPTSPQADRPAADLSFAEIRKKKGLAADAPKEPLGPASGQAGGLSIDDILQRTEVANLFFIAAGRPVANPTEMLSRPRFEELLNQLLQRYDKVVLDSAPVLGVSETLLIASRMQAVCFVVRGSQTPRRAILRAVEILRRGEVPLLGVVLNGITPKRSDPYGQDYYYHRNTGR